MMIQRPDLGSGFALGTPRWNLPAPRRAHRVAGIAVRFAYALLALLLCASPGMADEPGVDYLNPPGTQVREFTRFGIEMVPVTAGFTLESSGFGTSASCPPGEPFSYVETWMAPPHGVKLMGFGFVGFNINATNDLAMFAFRVCQSAIDQPVPSPTTTLLGTVTSGNPNLGAFAKNLDLSAGNEIVDARQCRYLLRARLSNEGNACTGTDMQIHKVIMRYRNPN